MVIFLGMADRLRQLLCYPARILTGLLSPTEFSNRNRVAF